MSNKAYLAQLNPEDLFVIAKTQKPVNQELLKIAADQGHMRSALLLGMRLRQGDNEAKKEALRYLKPIRETETADAWVLYLILQYQTSGMDKRQLHKNLCPLRGKKFIYKENQKECDYYVTTIYQELLLEDAPRYSYLDLPPASSKPSNTENSGAYGYSDVYGPSYHPDTHGPVDKPWCVNSGEVW
jgi:hypothetical protein